MPIPIDTRRKPASVKVHVSSGAGVDITWSDGHSSHYRVRLLARAVSLRDVQRRAGEKGGREGKRRAAEKGKSRGAAPVLSSPLLPMFKPKLRASAAHAVGNYALQIDFNDGHTTGIYSFDYLGTICPCEDCAREFRTPSD